jgi:hypothetical protein
MKRSDLAFSLAVALGTMTGSFASTAAADDTCTGFGAPTFSPAHPVSTDLVAVRVKSWPEPFTIGPATRTTLGQVQVHPGHAIHIDVIVTPHPEKYPGLRTVQVPYDDAVGLLGPLAIGDYSVASAIYYEDAQGMITKPCGGPFASVLKVGEERTPTVRAPVIEFYNAAMDHYFMTQNAAEIAALDNGTHPGWVRTGESFLAFAAGQSDNRGRPVCRYYGVPVPTRSTHFYSASLAECLQLGAAPPGGQWTLESSDVFEVGMPDRATGVCPIGQAPLYRLWNARADTNHRYTSSASTREQMVAQGWISEGAGPEGVAMCTPLRLTD